MAMPRAEGSFRCVFSINSGRCGSEYLARLLGTGKGVHGYHEAAPEMIGAVLDEVNAKPMAQSRNARRVKCASIREAMRGRSGTYVETNHMFIKTFHDVVVEEFADVEVIFLRRELARVVKSFFELGYFTPRNPAWSKWMSIPGGANSAVKPIAPFEALDAYDRIIAYLVDIETRGMKFAAEHPHVRLHEVRLESLDHTEGIRRLFEAMRIETTSATWKSSAHDRNERRDKKARFANPADLDYCRERVAMYLDKSRARGIAVPATLAVKPP
jgi:hypothetical protein